MALQNRQTQTKLLLFIYIFPETNVLCVCVCVLFLLINKNSSVLKSGKQVQTVKLRPIICIASQETINRNSLFVPQYRLFNKLVNFFSLCAVRIFLSLPTGNGNACVSRRVHPYVHCQIFINISRFSGWAVILSKDVGHYLKPINNLLILSFHSLKSLWLTEKKLEMNLYRQKCN